MKWQFSEDRRSAGAVVVAVAGVAGSGKSTLGRAIATTLRAPLLDLDSVTNPLLDRLPEDVSGGHWLASPHRTAIRDGRYAALRCVARDAVGTAGQAVLVAPFTAELRGGADWDLLREAVGEADLRMVHITGDAGLFAARRAGRGETRDRHRIPESATPLPGVPVITVDAALPTDQQVSRVLAALGPSVLDPQRPR